MAGMELFVRNNTPEQIENIKQALKKTTFVGIDFGTSTTTVTRLVLNTGTGKLESEPMKLTQYDETGRRGEDQLFPTVLAKTKRGLIYGLGAKACLQDNAHYAEGINAWSCIKMRMGEQYHYGSSRLSRSFVKENEEVIETPKDAVKLFFRNLKKEIEASVEREHLPAHIKYAVTVPASFAPNQRKELVDAVNDAGVELKDAALLDEPNSAFMGALAFYSEQGQADQVFRFDRATKALIFDFGAGTCDISLLEVDSQLNMRNVAISRFTALGGYDIDMRIATDYLYPRLSRTSSDCVTRDVKQKIINALLPTAERLKMAICQEYAKRSYEGAVYYHAEARDQRFCDMPFKQVTMDFGTFTDDCPYLMSSEFVKIMRDFTEEPHAAFETGHKTVLEPIADVLRKAGMSKEDVDDVIFVGGSAKNPFIQESLHNYFGRFVEPLAPGDIQTLVARGAAIHSFAVNGLGYSFVRPITSEDICIDTAEGRVCVFRTGTSVPSNEKEVEGLYIDDDDTMNGLFGIPFYAGMEKGRKLGVALFELVDIGSGVPVKLTCRLNESKVLEYRVTAAGKRFDGSFDMPVSSEDLTPRQLARVKAENDVQISMQSNNGRATLDALDNAAKACHQVKDYEAEVDHLRNLTYNYPNAHYEGRLGTAYYYNDDFEQGARWLSKAYERRHSMLTSWYLLQCLAFTKGWDCPEVKSIIDEAIATWPDDWDWKYWEFRRFKELGDMDSAMKVCDRICTAWTSTPMSTIDRFTLGRFREVANELGHKDLAKAIRNEMVKRDQVDGEDIKDASFTSVHSAVESK